MAQGAHSSPSTFAVFRRPDFRWLWTSQFVSEMGSAFTTLAASVLIFRETGSAWYVGLLLIATAVPGLLVAPVAGVFADRFDRKRLMIGSHLARAAVTLAIPLVAPLGIAWLYALVVLSHLVRQFFDPAYASLLPETASDDELASANALMSISAFGTTSIGFALAGLIAMYAPIAWAFYIDSISFVLAALCITRVRVASPPTGEQTTVATVLSDIREGADFVWQTPILRSLFLIYIPIGLSFGFVNAVLLPFAINALGASEFEYSLLEGLWSVGFVVGSLAMARLADRLHPGQWIAFGFIGIGVCNILFAEAPTVLFALVVYVIYGVINASSVIATRLILQRNTARENRGRVIGFYYVMHDVTFLAGMAGAGLADVLDPRLLYLIGGGVVVLVCGLAVLALPGLRQSVAEWRQTTYLLRGVRAAPGLGLGSAATLGDLDRLAAAMPVLLRLTDAERRTLLSQARVYAAAPGTAIIREGESGSDAYFLIEGRAVVGKSAGESQRALGLLRAGEICGEIAALMGVARTATVIAQEPSTLLQVPAPILRQLMGNQALSGAVVERMIARMEALSGFDPRESLAGLRPGLRAAAGQSQIFSSVLASRAPAPPRTAGAAARATVIVDGQIA